MEYNKEQIAGLIFKYKSGSISAEEREILEDWLSVESNRRYFNAIIRDPLVWDWNNNQEPDESRIWEKITAVLGQSPVVSLHRGFNWKKLAVAAAVVIIVATGSLWLWKNSGEGIPGQPVASVTASDLLPGADRATLTMGDGKVINLTDANAGEIARQAGVSIEKTADGRLLYRMQGLSPDEQPMEQFTGTAAMNKVSTPRGGQYQVLLPDQTSVWLNAASSIRFPTAFTGKTREVEITGEAYFEVKKDPFKPFIVKVNDAEITVLGTHFNVMGYPEEATTQTTLLEGGVRVVRHSDTKQLGNISKSESSITLKPGQQANMNKGGGIAVVNGINTDLAVAWVKGYFQFKNQDVATIMRQISRWYNIEVSYESEIPSGRYTGKISRFTNASEVLQLLKAGGIEYRIEGNRLIVH